jgi:hypothetical protein
MGTTTATAILPPSERPLPPDPLPGEIGTPVLLVVVEAALESEEAEGVNTVVMVFTKVLVGFSDVEVISVVVGGTEVVLGVVEVVVVVVVVGVTEDVVVVVGGVVEDVVVVVVVVGNGVVVVLVIGGDEEDGSVDDIGVGELDGVLSGREADVGLADKLVGRPGVVVDGIPSGKLVLELLEVAMVNRVKLKPAGSLDNAAMLA